LTPSLGTHLRANPEILAVEFDHRIASLAFRGQPRLAKGSQGSDPWLLGLTMGGYLIAHSGSGPVRSKIVRAEG
jgi:hypothetical protein